MMTHRASASRSHSQSSNAPSEQQKTPTNMAPSSGSKTKKHVKRVTLTSKKNWWMVELDPDDEPGQSSEHLAFSSSEDQIGSPPPRMTPYRSTGPILELSSPPTSPPVYNPPRHPTSIFSFPTPTAYAAPQNPTAALAPFAHGSASEVFKCIVKKPDVVQLEINGEMQSNASDVTIQFLAELRVYTTVARHRNICTFLGCLEMVGMVLEFIEGRTLDDVLKDRPMLSTAQKTDYHNQLLDGLTHLHSYGLSHGDLSLTNVQVVNGTNTIKLLDFGRSVSADSVFLPPDDDQPPDPFAYLARRETAQLPLPLPSPKVEQIHQSTRPFCAPEILRGECTDARLADAYGFGILLVCLDRCEGVDVKPWDQRKDLLPKDFFNGCDLFEERARAYLLKCDQRRRLIKEDMIH